jgi:D-tyrosyl-tRNA(Tyr) deacylase
MKAVIQRVKNASVTVDNTITGSIERGILVYLGIAGNDTEKNADWMAEKIINLRIFMDAKGKMNLSLLDIFNNNENKKEKIGVLTVSQFTLFADARKGRRPYYGDGANPEKAKELYEYFVRKIKEHGVISEAGIFQAHMDVTYTNDGPVTIIIDTEDL